MCIRDRGSLSRTRRDADGVSEGEQGAAGKAIMPAEHCQREGVIAIWQRGGEVIGGGDAPFACGRGQDGDVLRMDVPVTGEPREAELSEDVPGGERAGRAGSAEGADHLFSGDAVLVPGYRPRTWAPSSTAKATSWPSGPFTRSKRSTSRPGRPVTSW